MRKQHKLLLHTSVILILLGAFFLLRWPTEIQADPDDYCPSGVCLGTRVSDVPDCITDPVHGGCYTDWTRVDPVVCNNACNSTLKGKICVNNVCKPWEEQHPCCLSGGGTPEPTPGGGPDPSCTVSLDPSVASISEGTDVNYIASVNASDGSVDQVNFITGDDGIVSMDPIADGSSPYQSVGTALSQGSTTITADVYMGSLKCSDSATIEVTNPGPWWQVVDSDLITSGDIISSIPLSCALPGCNPLLGLEGLGGFPGVPVFGASLDTGSGDVSATNWSADTDTVFSKVYDYDFFNRLVRPDVTLTEIDQPSVNGGFFTSGGAPSRGYVWYHFDGDSLGDLVINSSVNMPGDRKVVVLVENADLYINDRINVVDGIGYMMFIVGKDDAGGKGNIYVDPGVSHPSAVEIEGVFFAEGQFRTGVSDNQLHVRGMVAALDGVVLERDLEGDNEDEPAEVFEFAPDFVLTFPRDLTFKRLRWKEVAP